MLRDRWRSCLNRVGVRAGGSRADAAGSGQPNAAAPAATPPDASGQAMTHPGPDAPGTSVAPSPLRSSRCPCADDDAAAADLTRREIAFAVVGALVVIGAVILVAVAPAPGLSDRLLQTGHLLVVATLVLAVVGVAGNRDGYHGEGYLAGILLMSPLSTWILAIVTVIAYVVASAGGTPDLDTRVRCIYVSIASAMAFTAAAAFVGRSVAQRSRAQAHVYDELRDRRSQLRDRHTRLLETRGMVEVGRLVQFDTLCLEAETRLAAAECDLCDPLTGRAALRWARATGYSNILRTLHRVEEVILAAQPDEAVLGDAFNDYLVLTGSSIAQRETLIANLRAATYAIDAVAADAFFNPTGPRMVPSAGAPSKLVAREVLREIRFAINDYRDSRVDRQIGTRNSLVFVMLAGAGVTYLTLGVAILAGVSTVALLSASVYFLVAALAGLLNRLRIESARTTAVEDYGLSIARLTAAPLLSGLAGIGGVYLVAKSPELFGSLFGQPMTQLTASQIFDLSQNELGLLVAVVFGFVPAAFFSSLQRQADRFQQELEKTEPSGGSSASTAAAS